MDFSADTVSVRTNPGMPLISMGNFMDWDAVFIVPLLSAVREIGVLCMVERTFICIATIPKIVA
jgi:hypothetical protein